MSVKGAVKKTVGAVAAACARDSELRSRVEADAKKALADEGLDLPFEEVKLVADTPETKHVALTPPGAELSDEQMEAVVGGWGGRSRPGVAVDPETGSWSFTPG